LSGLTPLVPGVSGDARRAESVAGFANINADYAESTAVAADQKALDAAIAADAAMTEAQFGSIAVGRLLAGTINVAIELTSPVIKAAGGDVVVDTNGVTIRQGTSTPRRIKFGEPGFGSDQVIYASTTSTLNIESSYVKINDAFQVNPTGRPSYDGTYLPLAGARTSANPVWSNGTGKTGNPLDYDTYPGAHTHQVADHTHTVTV